MIKRILDISSPLKLSLKHAQLVIERTNENDVAVPLEDLGVLILDHPGITHTQGLFAACAVNNVAVIICDWKHMPSSMLLPFEGNTLQARTVAFQIKAKLPKCKRLWKEIVRAKVLEQAKVLKKVLGNDGLLPAYAARVKSGDTENIEAQAARIYWQKLFGEKFHRDPKASGINSLLNYGYMVMRGALARAVVATGLHPIIGIHHRNQYNSFALVDDLLEPLRPVIDLRAYEISGILKGDALAQEHKRAMLEILSMNLTLGDLKMPLMTALHYYAASLRKALSGENKCLEIPGL